MRLKSAGRSDKGSRQQVLKRYRDHLRQSGEQEEATDEMVTLASEDPLIVMLDEETESKNMRAVDQKGLGEDGDLSWLVQDMHQELKAWGYPGGG